MQLSSFKMMMAIFSFTSYIWVARNGDLIQTKMFEAEISI